MRKLGKWVDEFKQGWNSLTWEEAKAPLPIKKMLMDRTLSDEQTKLISEIWDEQ